jgi:hypothetical protein
MMLQDELLGLSRSLVHNPYRKLVMDNC